MKKWSVKTVVVMAMFVALSVVLGKFLQIPIGNSFRISLENLPILAAGFLYGPVGGLVVGIASDLIGCLAVGYAIIPLITLAAGVNGLIAGLLRLVVKSNRFPAVLGVTLVSHVIGSMLVKSYALHIAFAQPWVLLLWRVPIYLFIAVAESCILYILLKLIYEKKVIKL